MNKNMKILAVVAVVVIVAAGAFVLMGNNNTEKKTVKVGGSTTIQPVMGVVAETYEASHNVKLQITAGGSGAGASGLVDGTLDVGMLSRDLKADELSKGLNPTIIGYDGIAVIINKKATGVENLTVAQLAEIFSGKKTNWSNFGGPDKGIVIITREDGSGTRDGFTEALKKADSTFKMATTAIEQASTGAMSNIVNSTDYAIGYVSIGALSGIGANTKAIKVDGVDPTVEHVLDKTYKIQRNLVLATKGEPAGEAKKLIDWILSEKGQKILKDKHFIPLAK